MTRSIRQLAILLAATVVMAAPALFLAGCAPGPHLHIDSQQPVTVKVPVYAACISRGQIPAPVPHAALTGEARHDVSVLAAVDLRLRDALGQAVAALSGCAG